MSAFDLSLGFTSGITGRAKRCEPTRPRCPWRTVKPSARTRASKTKPREKGGPLSLSDQSPSLCRYYSAELKSVELKSMLTLSSHIVSAFLQESEGAEQQQHKEVPGREKKGLLLFVYLGIIGII